MPVILKIIPADDGLWELWEWRDGDVTLLAVDETAEWLRDFAVLVGDPNDLLLAPETV